MFHHVTWRNLKISTSIYPYFLIARSESPDEDFLSNQNFSIIIIPYAKTILIKYFGIQKKYKRLGK